MRLCSLRERSSCKAADSQRGLPKAPNPEPQPNIRTPVTASVLQTPRPQPQPHTNYRNPKSMRQSASPNSQNQASDRSQSHTNTSGEEPKRLRPLQAPPPPHLRVPQQPLQLGQQLGDARVRRHQCHNGGDSAAPAERSTHAPVSTKHYAGAILETAIRTRDPGKITRHVPRLLPHCACAMLETVLRMRQSLHSAACANFEIATRMRQSPPHSTTHALIQARHCACARLETATRMR